MIIMIMIKILIKILIIITIITIIIKGYSPRKACLQPATNTQNSKPRPPASAGQHQKQKGKKN